MHSTDSVTPSTVVDVLVVGAGISGLSLAHILQRQFSQTQTSTRQVLVTERQDRVGGNIVTQQVDGFLWEEGPNSFSPTPALLKLIVDVGLEQDLVLADRRLPRYIYWQGKLQPVPMSPSAIVRSQLLSPLGKLRALAGALGFVTPAIGLQLSQQGGEETVAQFFRRHLGQEVAERLVAPFVSGVYAGDPQQLSANAAFERMTRMEEAGGGLLAGAILSRLKAKKSKPVADPTLPKTRPGELGSFKGGLAVLPKAIAEQLGDRLRLSWHLTRLQSTEKQTYIAEFSTPEGQQTVEAKAVVLTTPAYLSADWLEALHPQISQPLREFYYPPVACVVMAYPEAAIAQSLQGFGNLIPRNQGIRTLGTIWASSLFPGRAPQGWQMFINFIGGATDPGIANLNSDQIAQAVHQDLRRILLKENVEPKVLAVHLWKQAIPQYTLGHRHRLQQINQALEKFPGLYLCSNYIDGVSLGDCVRRAQEKAIEVSEYLNR
jgi:protoporphyrinogen/coproporphyrinogen III oxidase